MFHITQRINGFNPVRVWSAWTHWHQMNYDNGTGILGELLILTWILPNIGLASGISRVSVSSQGWLMPKLSSVYNMHSITKLNLNCPSYCYHSGIPLATRDNPLSADLDSEARLCISNSECIFGLRMWRLCWHSGPASINCRISTEKPNRCCYLPRCKSLAQLS